MTDFEDNIIDHIIDDDSINSSLKNYKLLSSKYVGRIHSMGFGQSIINFIPDKFMVVNEENMIQAGFVFGAANYSAMVAVNEEHSILSSTLVNFNTPIFYGDEVTFEAKMQHKDARKKVVKVVGMVEKTKVFEGDFIVVMLDAHVLNLRLRDRSKD